MECSFASTSSATRHRWHMSEQPNPWDDEWCDVLPGDADRVAALIRSGVTSTVSGGLLDEFELGFARFSDASHCVSFCNGTSAIYTALRAVGVGINTEVLVPDYAYHAVLAAVLAAGARAIPCDIDAATLTLDPPDVARKRTVNARAVVAHCPWGVPPNGGELRRAAAGIPIIFDASHAHGSLIEHRPLTHFADVVCYSLGRNKLVSGGERGAATTENRALRDRLLIMAHVNRVPEDLSVSGWRGNAVGLKGRPHPAALCLAISQLARADEKIRSSRETCRAIEDSLRRHGLMPQGSHPGSTRSYWRVVSHPGADLSGVPLSAIRDALITFGVPIEANPYWPLLQASDVATWPEHADRVVSAATPVAHRVVPRLLTLPAPILLGPEKLAKIDEALGKALQSAHSSSAQDSR